MSSITGNGGTLSLSLGQANLFVERVLMTNIVAASTVGIGGVPLTSNPQRLSTCSQKSAKALWSSAPAGCPASVADAAPCKSNEKLCSGGSSVPFSRAPQSKPSNHEDSFSSSSPRVAHSRFVGSGLSNSCSTVSAPPPDPRSLLSSMRSVRIAAHVGGGSCSRAIHRAIALRLSALFQPPTIVPSHAGSCGGAPV